MTAASAALRSCLEWALGQVRAVGHDALLPRGGVELRGIGLPPTPASDAAASNESTQTATFQTETVLTRDAVPVTLVVGVTWTRDGPAARGQVRQERESIVLTGQALMLALVGSSGLADLMEERPALQDQLCRDLGRALAACNLCVSTVTIDAVALPVGLQAEHDAHMRAALRDIVARKRKTQLAD